jgi:hypothetical protein
MQRSSGNNKGDDNATETAHSACFLLSAATTQVAAAAEHRHVRAKNRAALCEQVRNSNAYAGNA